MLILLLNARYCLFDRANLRDYESDKKKMFLSQHSLRTVILLFTLLTSHFHQWEQSCIE